MRPYAQACFRNPVARVFRKQVRGGLFAYLVDLNEALMIAAQARNEIRDEFEQKGSCRIIRIRPQPRRRWNEIAIQTAAASFKMKIRYRKISAEIL